MKKSLAKKVTLSILAGAVLMSSSVVWARDITNVAPGGSGGEWVYVDIDTYADTYAPKDENSSYPSASNNRVVFTDHFDKTVDKSFVGGYSDSGAVESNTVTISGGKFDAGGSSTVNIYGGYAKGSGNAGGGTADKGNKVIINGGTFSYVDIYGGYAKGSGNATHNEVVISGVDNGSIFDDIYGGRSDGNGAVEKNTVTISDGKIDGYVYGGRSYNGDAKGNTVNISGEADLSSAWLYGGYSSNGTVSGNVLNVGVNSTLKSELEQKGIDVTVGAWQNKKVKYIDGFDVINFAYVDWEKDGTVVEVTDKLALNNTEIKVGTVNVAGGITLANGDKMALISATGSGVIDGNISNNGQQVVINKGVAEKYNGYVEKVDNDRKIYLKLGDGPAEGYTVPATPPSGTTPGGGTPGGGIPGGSAPGGGTPEPERNDQVLVLGESRAAAVAFTNQGSELIETGLDALARDNSKDTKVFAAVYGNHSEYETGSHVNVNGWSGIVGIGKTNANGLTVGAFFENGEGNYSTHNIFTADYIRGDGEACYNGGGLIVRKDNANGVYAEASLRAGNLQNELRNAVRNGQELTGYDVDTFYYGAHIGIGKVIPRGADGDSLDVYGKFIYTHHDGETFDVGGTATKFDSVESERLRLGFRINEVQTNKLSMYYGAAWEYEFNGDAHDKIASFDLETPSLGGSTVIGEIGMHYKASEKWSLDLNGRAYVGQREGFSGSVQANYSF